MEVWENGRYGPEAGYQCFHSFFELYGANVMNVSIYWDRNTENCFVFVLEIISVWKGKGISQIYFDHQNVNSFAHTIIMPAPCARSVSLWKYSFIYTLSYKVFAKLCNVKAVDNIFFVAVCQLFKQKAKSI